MNKSISFYGETVQVQPRTATTTDDTGEVTYTYPEADWYETKCLLYDASGLREAWYEIGRQDETEFVGSFYANLIGSIKPADRVYREDGTLLIVDFVIDRGRGNSKDYLEVLLKRGN